MNTSEYLRSFLEDFDRDYAEENPESESDSRLHEILRRIEVDSIEALLPPAVENVIRRLRSRKDILESSFDDYYSRLLLNEVPEIVRRAIKLVPSFAQEDLAQPVEVYLREATRSYLFGFFQGSVALSRSTLEQALRERVRSQAPMFAETDVRLELVKAAEWAKLLDAGLLQLAHEVRQTANQVLHGEPCAEQDAFDVLAKNRKVVEALYGGQRRR